MNNKEYENAMFVWGEMLDRITAKILLNKLKNKEKFDKGDYQLMQILLEHIIRGKNEE